MSLADPRSFYSSPAEATPASPEEVLYLACIRRGTGVQEPDFIANVAAEHGRIVHETPMPSPGDELHHFDWNRCSSACHGPDRSHLIVPGFRSSRVPILDMATDPRRPRTAHHEALPALAPGAVAASSGMLAVVRSRIATVKRWLRRR